MHVEWDHNKNVENQRKHGLSFEEASALFDSETDYLEIFDEDHSATEDRFICIGAIRAGLVLVVTTEPAEAVVRIISARKATKSERELYRSYMEGREE